MENKITMIETIGKENLRFDNPCMLEAIKGMLVGMQKDQISEITKVGNSYSELFLKIKLGVTELTDSERVELITHLVMGVLSASVVSAIEGAVAEIDEVIAFNKGDEPDNGESESESESEGEAESVLEDEIAGLILEAIFGALTGKGKGEA
ncbi:hypothetical protein P5E39_12700 [Clostridium perfringens]|uniref:hypothetical protein n=1 Tax=Clostridium perfringens TaxID=1502 RepID=UPI0034A27726|nr:hypothetical protein [Clostridium perfringens]MDM0781074.1 hypothetical protein [Clostridium perfringens]